MSVDYDAYYGIGYEVEASSEVPESHLEDGLLECISGEVGDDFFCFETGNCFSGEMTGVFIGVKEPFKDGLDLTAKKEMLDDELTRLKLEPVSEFGEIGGSLVW